MNNAAIVTWNGTDSVNDSALTSTATALTRDLGEDVGVRNVLTGTFTAPSTNYNAPALAGGTLTILPADLTASITNQNKTYGADDPGLGTIPVTLGGLVNRTVSNWNGNVLVDDSALTSSVTSLARDPGEDVGSYAVMAGVFSAPSTNYSAPMLAGGTLTITPKAISVAANAQSKVYGSPDPALTYTASGIVNATVIDWNGNSTAISDTAGSALSGALTRAAGENVAGSPYAISGGTLAATANYNVASFTGNNLTITPAALSITANDASRPANQPNPPFTASFTGFRLGDTPGSLSGTLMFSTPATLTSLPGSYAIVPSGLASNNYAIQLLPGTLRVGISLLTGIDPLQSVTSVWLTPATYESPQPALPISGAFILAEVEEGSVGEFLSRLPATAAGPGEQPPPEGFAGSCVGHAPFSVLRCLRNR